MNPVYRSTAGIDEDTFGLRPTKRSRPRSKQRPAHSDSVPGTVTSIHRGRYLVMVGDSPSPTAVTCMKARELGRLAIVVGDHVDVVGDTSGAPDSLARIVAVSARTTQLRRTADDDDPYERVIVANVDQLAIVVAAADPPPRIGLIDRCLVAAYTEGIEPLIVVTKTDLADTKDLTELYSPLGVRIRELGYDASRTVSEAGVSNLKESLVGSVSVLVGHSGVGKSTLVNRLAPTADRLTGSVNRVTGRGRHTSTSAAAWPLSEGGWVIDTPGIRSFGLAHITSGDVVAAFDDLAEATRECPRGCRHRGPESHDECALDAAVADGLVPTQRLDSVRRIVSVLDDSPTSL